MQTFSLVFADNVGGGGGKGLQLASGGDDRRIFGGVRIRDLVSFSVPKRFLGHQSQSWFLLGYLYCS